MQHLLFSKCYIFLPFFILFSFCESQDDSLKQNEKSNIEMEEMKYRHYAILGRGQFEMFSKLNVEERKAKLSEIIDQMDLNHDGMIDVLELKSWIKNAYSTLLEEDVEISWKSIVKDNKDKINFQDYIAHALKTRLDMSGTLLKKIEERRWEAADLDKDNLLNKNEFLRFLHPQEFRDMHPILAQESLEELDKDNDGYVDIDEYMKNIFPEDQEIKEEWIRHERQNFGIDRDMNKDGFLDREEIQNWLLPDNYDRIGAEAEHLIERVGGANSKVLTKSAMLDKYYIFVGPSEDHFHEDL